MRRQIDGRLCVVLALALVLGAGADKKPHYVSSDAVDVKALLPDPPKAGSQEQLAEISLILELQHDRSDVDVQRAKSEEKFTVFAFASDIGPWFTAENCPRTAALFKQIESDSKVFSWRAKDLWDRPRPPLADTRVKPAVTLEEGTSYPSGHATRGMLMAEVLVDIFPQKRAELLDHARQIGWDRVIGGVHYPSDVNAGRVLGHAIARAIMASTDFQHDLAAVKEELEHAASGSHASEPVHTN